MQNIETKQQQIEGSYIECIISAVQEINDAVSPYHDQHLDVIGDIIFEDDYEIYIVDYSGYVFMGGETIESMTEIFTKIMREAFIKCDFLTLTNITITVTNRSFIIYINTKKNKV